jgi:hypothetical protein
MSTLANASSELSDVMSKAKTRWGNISDLFLNGSGNYDATSEVILNKLAD